MSFGCMHRRSPKVLVVGGRAVQFSFDDGVVKFVVPPPALHTGAGEVLIKF